MENIILKVNGMHCAGCETRIKNALESIKGVKKVNANHSEKTVEISFRKNSDILDNIKETIEDLGFEVVKEE